ncbi:MAG: flagellar hook protein FlgE [Desulfomicrobium sp.]|nr:flagellar hook protein FlgE [Pseudomonadota bacterium]MBV1714241.1 flagellar hook protein FlgE [Desulfomicrobium sp.]MBU4570980.1 flagellar hook protein FlgE [Pseudomonadota bacterium]MBU4594598.1 flagellar hook protein FlgE [Pseudomonadota bacterium]MBV1721773.1 flagellar hook protein FlgE [Desulfomicrobium sp.]
MGLSASMYSGTSGLKAHGEKMTVIGNNISNVSTIGFKASRMYFEDALSQQITTASGGGQVGRGVSVGAVMGDFSQGSLENTTEATDLAIGGNGFFMVSPAGQELNYYTRAGNFRFDEEGFLVDPRGYRLQGWAVQTENTSAAASGGATASESAGVKIKGVPTDVKLENFQSPPQATSRVDMILNIDSQSEDRTTANGAVLEAGAYDGTPFTAMFEKWDGSAIPPLGDAQYAYQSTIKVYDENGTSHNMTVYMDPVLDPDVAENSGGKRYMEYIVTVPPGEDNREFWGTAGIDATKRGILMAGTLTFNAAGELEDMSAFSINNPYLVEPVPGPATFDPTAADIGNWTPANFSQNGYPICTANFLGAEHSSVTASETSPDGATIIPAMAVNNSRNIELNFGLRNKDAAWTDPTMNLADLRDIFSTSNTTVSAIGALDPVTDAVQIATLRAQAAAEASASLSAINGMQSTEISALSTTSYSTGSTTIFQAQDGYTAGFLQNISVDRDGVITGRYSNGQVLQLFAVTLATFNNNYALFREGGNLFSETRSSGPPITGLANTGGKGSIASNSLEQSNVDLATEFVKMITTEKGFQANSKTITTVDQMLTVLIQLKR